MKVILVLVCLAVLGIPAVSLALCTGGSPEVVIDCFNEAMENHHLNALEGLLAPDFVQMYKDTGLHPVPNERRYWIAAIAMIFEEIPEGPHCTSMEFCMWRDYDFCVYQESVDAWRIEGLRYEMSITGIPDRVTRDGKLVVVDKPQTNTLNKYVTLYVRQVMEPEPHYQIYLWEECEEPPIQ